MIIEVCGKYLARVNRVFRGLADHCFNTSLSSLLCYNILSSSSLGTVFMFTKEEVATLSICLEGLLYGKYPFYVHVS